MAVSAHRQTNGHDKYSSFSQYSDAHCEICSVLYLSALTPNICPTNCFADPCKYMCSVSTAVLLDTAIVTMLLLLVYYEITN